MCIDNTKIADSIEQSLSEILKRRSPIITKVEATGPSEVYIGIEFLEQSEDTTMRKMEIPRSIEYKVEICNEEECGVRSEQVLSPSHKAFIEWRFLGGENRITLKKKCKLRVRAVWRDSFGEECLSEWSDWTPFAVPKEHKSNGLFGTGVVWEAREDGERYTVMDETVGRILYVGTNTYTMIPWIASGHEIKISGCKGKSEWEEIKTIENISCIPENFLEDLRLFHSDEVICAYVLERIASFIDFSEEYKVKFAEVNGVDVITSIIRNHINNDYVCECGFNAICKIINNNFFYQKYACNSSIIELARDAIEKHNDNNAAICEYGLCVIYNVVQDGSHNQKLAGELGCVELICDVLKKYVDDVIVCEYGLSAIYSIICGILPNQKEVGLINCLLEIIEHNKCNKSIVEWCCKCFSSLISSQKDYVELNNENILKSILECHEKYCDSEIIENCLSNFLKKVYPNYESECTYKSDCIVQENKKATEEEIKLLLPWIRNVSGMLSTF